MSPIDALAEASQSAASPSASPVLVTDAAALRVTTGHATADDALAAPSAADDVHRGMRGSHSRRPCEG